MFIIIPSHGLIYHDLTQPQVLRFTEPGKIINHGLQTTRAKRLSTKPNKPPSSLADYIWIKTANLQPRWDLNQVWKPLGTLCITPAFPNFTMVWNISHIPSQLANQQACWELWHLESKTPASFIFNYQPEKYKGREHRLKSIQHEKQFNC